jgi:hypothetical protein
MADERQFGTQKLISATYLVEAEDDFEPEAEHAEHRVRPRRSGLELMVRWLTPLLIIMLIASAGGFYWLNRASIASTAGELGKRRSVFDVLLYLSGSKETFSSALRKRLDEAQRDSAFQFDKAKFHSELEGVDLQNLSQAWNGKR